MAPQRRGLEYLSRGSCEVEARSSGGGESGGASRRSQRALSIGLGLGRRWGAGGYGEPRILSPSPHLLFIALRDGGPLARRTAERPRSGCESGSDSVVGPSRVEINLTCYCASSNLQGNFF